MKRVERALLTLAIIYFAIAAYGHYFGAAH
jgi:hypothetical protein